MTFRFGDDDHEALSSETLGMNTKPEMGLWLG